MEKGLLQQTWARGKASGSAAAGVIHHRRREDGQGIDTRVLTAGDIRLDPPGITITVEEVYAG